jgi:hypothetical protein
MVKISVVFLVMALAAPLALAQRHRMGAVDLGTPEGQLLQQIQREQDAAKKIGLLEQYATQYPKGESIPWAYELLMNGYAKAGQDDKVIEAGQKLIAADPGDLTAAHECLKAAEAKKDPALILKWAVATSEMARKVVQSPEPTAADEAEAWKRNVDYAKQVDVYTEYALYAALLQTSDPKAKVQLGEALEERNPKSPYMAQAAQPLFLAYLQAGENEKALAFAERCLDSNQASEEMMLTLAQSYLGKKEAEKAIALSEKAIQAAEAKQKPEGVPDADWQTWRGQIAGRGQWISGVGYASLNKWAQADKALRAALPGVRGNNAMLAEALFYLGLANYRIAESGETERARDALRFSEECAQIASPFQAQARINVRAIRSRYRIR